ncbi:sensor histidine kinase [Winogradskyella poriferorum]|uniref:sensor histidine kinase n=1 Tax=Winogradskyella poriferorum TaxID=307627 RepID=UPI003D653D9C
MKKSYFDIQGVLSLIFFLLFSTLSGAQALPRVINISVDFKEVSLTDYGTVDPANAMREDYFYFGFEKNINTIRFKIRNTTSVEKRLILELSNALIDEVSLLKGGNHNETISRTGINYSKKSRPIDNRLFVFDLNLKPKEIATYHLQLRKEKGKPLVTSVYIKSDNHFYKKSAIQLALIGTYYGISLLSVLFSLFIAIFLKKYSYIIYALYIVFLGLFISSYTGLFSLFFLNEDSIFDKYTNYVLFSEISLMLFIIFSQKILEAKNYMPRLKRGIDFLLITLISIRLAIHFFLTEFFNQYVSVFMKLWYLVFLIMVVLISIEIFKFFKTNFKRSSLFAIAYVFMITGVLLTILYHSYGLINTIIYGLPIIFYSSFLEILFLTFTVIYMVKDIYDERNVLSKKLILEEKKNLFSFVKGEDKERKRISRELHDNIGSQLGYLRRFVDDKFNNTEISDALDNICNNVRNLSHEISPSDLNLVGLENAIKDLSSRLNNQTSLKVSFEAYEFPEIINENKALQIYRAIQEIFNNVLKHSKAKNLDIQLIGHGDHSVITIEDDGIGFDNSTTNLGHGLKNINLRINQIEGSVDVDSKLDKGTSFIISFPN